MRAVRLASTPLLLAMLTGCSGASGEPHAPKAPTPVTLACPSLASGSVDFSKLFGVDAKLEARLQRTLRFADTLERTARELSQEASAACRDLTRDLGGAVGPEQESCSALSERVKQLRQSLNGGFSARVSELRCSVSSDELARCAGECLTGQAGVTSAVSCVAGEANSCSLDLSLPNASRECATKCAAGALSAVRCSGQVELRIGSGEATPPEYAAMADALRRDLPRLFGLAIRVAPRGAAIARDAVSVIDDLASSIDDLSRVKVSLDRRAVGAAVLGTCVAPQLAQIVRQSASLQTVLSVAAQAQASFVTG